MKVIITGASGFVGQNLTQYLRDNGTTVTALSLRGSWVVPVKGEALVHLAGKAHDTKNVSKEEDYYAVNRDLTVSLFDEYLKSDIRDFFYFSSVKAVADSVDGILTEDVIPNPKTPYGKSKLEAEKVLLSRKLPAGKRLFIIRPCMIHGPGNKGNLNLLYKVVKKGLPWPLAGFENQRSFLGIDNLNFLIEKMIADINIPSGIYNFSDDKSLSTNKLVGLIAENLRKKTQLWKINPGMISALARLGDLVRLPLNSERLLKLTESYVVSNAKIKEVLKINELPNTVSKGLSRTIRSFED